MVPPDEVVTVTELTDSTDELMNDERATGALTIEPDGVVMTSVTYGVDDPGVEMVDQPPLAVVTTTVSGDGTWTVA